MPPHEQLEVLEVESTNEKAEKLLEIAPFLCREIIGTKPTVLGSSLVFGGVEKHLPMMGGDGWKMFNQHPLNYSSKESFFLVVRNKNKPSQLKTPQVCKWVESI